MKLNDVTFAHVFGYFPWPAKVLEVKEKTVTVYFFHTMEVNTVKKSQTSPVTAQSIRKFENKYGERKGFSDALKELYAFAASHGLQFCPEESSLRAVKNPLSVHTSISSNILNDERKKGHASMPPSDPPSPQLSEIVSSQVVRTRELTCEPLGVSAFEALLTPLSSAPVDPVKVAEMSGLSTDSPTCDPRPPGVSAIEAPLSPPPNAPVNPVKVAKPVATQQLVPESSGQGKDVVARKLQITSAGLSGPARPDQTKSISLKRKSTEQKLNDLNKSMADNLENILTPVAPKKNKQIKNVRKEKNVCKGRPVNPYILYFNDRQGIIKQENPNMVHKEISKIVAVEWSSLKSDNPDKYLEYQTIYQKNLESYKSSKDATLKNNDIENAVSDEKDLKKQNDQLKEENETILKENLHLKRQNSIMQKEIEQLNEEKQNLEKEKNELTKAYSQSKEVVEKLIKK